MRLLVIRTSAMGDVALVSPILDGMRKRYPDVDLVILTRQAYKPFFSSIEGLQFFSPDLKKKHNGLSGLIRLYNDITKEFKIDFVIDLHDVLRSKILRLIFWFSGTPSAVIDKGRSEKKSVITGRKKVRLKHSIDRYCDVFARAGFPVAPAEDFRIIPSPEAFIKADSLIDQNAGLNIGFAPYTKHILKMWPEENMIGLLRMISENHRSRFWLFGGEEESEKAETFMRRVPDSFNTIGKLNLDEELALMSRLDFMIAMDSSNMHMAALAGTKVISIWGGTDPLSGFGAWMQPENFSIRIPVETLICRPCTTFGKGICRRGDFACMNWLTTEIVFQKMDNLKIW